MAGRLLEESRPVEDRTAFLIGGTKYNPANPGKADCAGAHGAGLQSDKQFQPAQPIIAALFGGHPNGPDLGMGGRIMARNRCIPGRSNDAVVCRINDHGTDRHFASFSRSLRLGQCQ